MRIRQSFYVRTNDENIIGYDSLGYFTGSLLAGCGIGITFMADCLAVIDTFSRCADFYGSFPGLSKKNSVLACKTIGL